MTPHEGHRVEVRVPEDAAGDRAGEVVEVQVPPGEAVLDAARDQGLWLPADCRTGWCTTCAARVLEGEVDQSRSRRYYEADRDAGFALLCTAVPCSDLVVVSHRQRELLEHRARHDLPPGRAKLG